MKLILTSFRTIVFFETHFTTFSVKQLFPNGVNNSEIYVFRPTTTISLRVHLQNNLKLLDSYNIYEQQHPLLIGNIEALILEAQSRKFRLFR